VEEEEAVPQAHLPLHQQLLLLSQKIARRHDTWLAPRRLSR
jgi:hypothetical protein